MATPRGLCDLSSLSRNGPCSGRSASIMNRWGRIVYHSEDYQNDWDGGGLSDGTYFYILKCHGLKEVVQYQGAVMIVTKARQ